MGVREKGRSKDGLEWEKGRKGEVKMD